MMPKLRVVVFTAGEMTAIDRIFYERLANDPLLDVAAIVVDEYRPPRKPLLRRIVRAIGEDGPHWVVFKIASKLRAMRDRVALRMADWIHGPERPQSDLPVLMHRVSDIHSAETAAVVRSLHPDLGVIVVGASSVRSSPFRDSAR